MANYTADMKKAFVNPYNFVGLGGDVERLPPYQGENTGVISCTLKNTTPLFIPDSSTSTGDTTDDHKTVEFFKINDSPVIPGSEIRGVIRSAYEALSNSCLSVNNNNILSARSSGVRNPGAIRFKDGKWELHSATATRQKYGSAGFNETETSIMRKWKNYEYRGKKKVSNNKIDVLYRFDINADIIPCSDLESAVEDFEEVIKIYKKNCGEHYFANIPTLPKKDGKYFPLYYLTYVVDGKTYVYLSPAQLSRSVFRNKVDDLLKTHARCTDPNYVCEACNLFGMVGSKRDGVAALASRLRFTDADIATIPKFKEKVTLKELSGPKISSVEFYTNVPNHEKLWTYDDKNIALNGRKFYFHHNDTLSESYIEKTKRNITAQILEKDAEFKFNVYFENISDEELHRLIWVLAIGENEADSRLQHKIGHGKPLGLGSCKITVDSVKCRSFDSASALYENKNLDTSEFFETIPFDENSNYFKDFMKIANFDTVARKNVSYPIADKGTGTPNSTASHVWFVANRGDGQTGNSETPPSVRFVLPRLTDSKLELPALIAAPSGNFNSTSRNKRTNAPYKGPTSFESKTSSVSKKTLKCDFCKKPFDVEVKNVFSKYQDVECPHCKKAYSAFMKK